MLSKKSQQRSIHPPFSLHSSRHGSSCSSMVFQEQLQPVRLPCATSSNIASFVFMVGPDFGQVAYTSVVNNDGPATAHNVVFTDTFLVGLEISSGYCDVGSCWTPVTTTLGTSTVSGKTITCNPGAMAPRTSATTTIPIQVLAAGRPSRSLHPSTRKTPQPPTFPIRIGLRSSSSAKGALHPSPGHRPGFHLNGKGFVKGHDFSRANHIHLKNEL